MSPSAAMREVPEGEMFVGTEGLPGEIVPQTIRARSPFLLLRVFRHRNYRLFSIGQVISQIGNWINNVAQGWLVYNLTHSPLLLGIVSFAGQVPVFFLSYLGGMISDRFNRRRILLVTQSLSIVESAGLAMLTFTGEVRPWHVIMLALFQGLVNAIDIPTRQAMTMEMVGKKDLRVAVSINSMMFNFARLVAPPIAGLFIALVGTALCFMVDALSYCAVLASLLWMRFTTVPRRTVESPRHELKAGLTYILNQREICISLILIAACSAFGASYVVMLPAFVHDVLRQGAEGLGLLYGAIGGGALVGAYAVAQLPDRHHLNISSGAAVVFGISLIALSCCRSLTYSALMLLATSLSLVLLGGSTNMLVQTLARDDVRGRAVALYATCFMGMMPWGALLLGWIAVQTGTAEALMIGGCMCIFVATATWLDRCNQSKIERRIS